ncbi:glycosyltransferase [Nocardioides sp. Kera G14]|uniref:glycosyltransferase n=1 Tax=Nocardioides sp. Kera G14 TaxID=2884264 RepID=UPI001D1282EB|nr:glycosyltransferase [Nocardioides sp. Kera G14]UDY22959.1 glycosyltransferase [Nocardioides sp. Kera G14]
MTRVLSLYEGFFAGGARILHTAVVRNLHATTDQDHRVLSLTNRVTREFTIQAIDTDTSYRRLVSASIPVRALDRGPTDPLKAYDLHLIAREIRYADVLFSLKEQPLDALLRVGTRGTPLVTALHRSDPEHSGAALGSLVEVHRQGLLSAAVCCSHATQRAYHAATGIPLTKLPVIPNGVDLYRFAPNAQRGADVRQQLGIPAGAPVVLIAARNDPMKDIPTFLRAARLFLRHHPRAHFILCGAGMTTDNPDLTRLLTLRLRSRVHALGIQPQMAPLYNAADLVALTSAYGEAAPLCLLEGMASGAVPVTTDVGDAALMVGDPRLVTTHEPRDIAHAWGEALAAKDEHVERLARHRQRLNEQHCFDSYARLLRSYEPSAV